MGRVTKRLPPQSATRNYGRRAAATEVGTCGRTAREIQVLGHSLINCKLKFADGASQRMRFRGSGEGCSGLLSHVSL